MRVCVRLSRCTYPPCVLLCHFHSADHSRLLFFTRSFFFFFSFPRSLLSLLKNSATHVSRAQEMLLEDEFIRYQKKDRHIKNIQSRTKLHPHSLGLSHCAYTSRKEEKKKEDKMDYPSPLIKAQTDATGKRTFAVVNYSWAGSYRAHYLDTLLLSSSLQRVTISPFQTACVGSLVRGIKALLCVEHTASFDSFSFHYTTLN